MDLQIPYPQFAKFVAIQKSQTDAKTRLIEVDDFIAKLWEVHLAVKKEGYVQVPFPDTN